MSDLGVENGDRTLIGVGRPLPETVLRRLELDWVLMVFITSMRMSENSHKPSFKERSSRLSVIVRSTSVKFLIRSVSDSSSVPWRI